MDLDDRLVLPGAEGIDLSLVLAGIASRGAALLVDTVLQFLVMLAVVFIAPAFGDADVAFVAISSFLVVFGYPTLMEGFNDGRTVGKAMLSIAVVDADGTPASFLQVAIRNILRVIDLLPGVYTVALISALATKKAQRLGDLAAGTIVVRRAKATVGYPAFDAGLAWSAPGSPVGDAYGGGGGATAPAPAGPAASWGATPSAAAAAPPEIAHWDTSAITADELAAVRSFLTRRHDLPLQHRNAIAATLATQVAPKVAGVPLDGGPELLLERIAYAKSFR